MSFVVYDDNGGENLHSDREISGENLYSNREISMCFDIWREVKNEWDPKNLPFCSSSKNTS